MKEREVYLKAAKQVGHHPWELTYTCVLVKNIGSIDLAKKYSRVMANAVVCDSRFEGVFGDKLGDPYLDTFSLPSGSERQDLRIWLLCMMAACCEDV